MSYDHKRQKSIQNDATDLLFVQMSKIDEVMGLEHLQLLMGPELVAGTDRYKDNIRDHSQLSRDPSSLVLSRNFNVFNYIKQRWL